MSEFIFPGKEIATTEEAVAGQGTAEENGSIVSSVIGIPSLNGGKAGVINPKAVRMLAKGDVIYGKVFDVFDQVAMIQFKPTDGNIATGADMSFLRISEVQKGYTDSFRDILKIGDLVKARILDVSPLGVYLTIAAPELGVVRAFCSACRGELDSKLYCSYCDRAERRKMADGGRN